MQREKLLQSTRNNCLEILPQTVIAKFIVLISEKFIIMKVMRSRPKPQHSKPPTVRLKTEAHVPAEIILIDLYTDRNTKLNKRINN